MLNELRVKDWSPSPSLSEVKIVKVSGALTNAVFFVSHPSARTLLLRIYGPSSSDLISRPQELHTLHVLSSVYRIGPRVYGTFGNGRVEEFFDSVALTAAELRDPQISQWIGARMAEFHSVDSMTVAGERDTIAARKNIKAWVDAAKDVLAHVKDEDIRRTLDVDAFMKEWDAYWTWLRRWETEHGKSRRAFCHNDTQYGNLLRLKNPPQNKPAHHQIIVVDFEYAAPNSAAFDIANHFHEWTADYHDDVPHLLDFSRYPTLAQRENFYRSYLATAELEKEITVETLEQQVRAWSPASHAMWTIWGIVQAREGVLADDPGEFDYLGYSMCRLEGFRREVKELGVAA